MYSTVEYLDGFVVDQWPDLETAALLVVLDPVTAREVTAAAMAAFGRRWSDALEEGRPVRRCREELLRRLARLPPRPYSDEDLEAVSGPSPGGAGDADRATVTRVLLRALADQPARSRVHLACDVCWGLTPAEAASLTGAAVPEVESDLASIRAALLEARRDAGSDADGAPLERLREDLDHLLAALSGGPPAPADALRLVTAHASHARRRTVVVAGLAAAAVGALGWVAIREAPRSRTATPTATSSPGPEDGVWSTMELWPARGALSADPEVRSLAGRVGMRLLWADEVDGLSLAVAGRVDPLRRNDTISAWVGRSGGPVTSLRRVEFGSDPGSPRQRLALAPGPRDVVTLVLPRTPGSVLVVLSRPTWPKARLSRTVTATTAGELVRDWEAVPLVDGIGVLSESTGLGAATRVRVGLFDGEPLRGDEATQPGAPSDDLVADLRRQVRALITSATGVPPHRVRSEVLVDESIRDGGSDRTLHVVVLLSRLPNGAVVRSVRLDDASSPSPRSVWYLEAASVVPAGQAHAPIVGELWNHGPSDSTGRFVVIAPGASRARLTPSGTSPGGRGSGVAALHGGVGLVVARRRFPAGTFRLELRDGRGRRTYDDVPPEGRFLLDLGV